MRIIQPVKMRTDMLVSSTAVDSENEWNGDTSYDKGNRVKHDDAQKGPSVWQSAIDHNEGQEPGVSPDAWVRVGPTNSWALFDGSASTLSASNDGFAVSFKPNEMVDSLAFFEVKGSAITVRMTISPDDEVVFERTIPLLNDSLIVDWYAYFFAPFDFIRDGLVFDIPPYGASATIHVEVEGAGETGAGEIVVGTVIDLGTALHGASHGIRDYSRVEEDDFGNVVMQKRAWSKRADFPVVVKKSWLRYASRVLTDLRGEPAVFIGSDDADYEPLVLYGFIKDWRNVIDYPENSLINIEIQGLK